MSSPPPPSTTTADDHPSAAATSAAPPIDSVTPPPAATSTDPPPATTLTSTSSGATPATTHTLASGATLATTNPPPAATTTSPPQPTVPPIPPSLPVSTPPDYPSSVFASNRIPIVFGGVTTRASKLQVGTSDADKSAQKPKTKRKKADNALDASLSTSTLRSATDVEKSTQKPKKKKKKVVNAPDESSSLPALKSINACARRLRSAPKKKTTKSSSSGLSETVRTFMAQQRSQRTRIVKEEPFVEPSLEASVAAETAAEAQAQALLDGELADIHLSDVDSTDLYTAIDQDYNEAFARRRRVESDREDDVEGPTTTTQPSQPVSTSEIVLYHPLPQHETGRHPSPPLPSHDLEQIARDIPLGEEGNWMPGGPRSSELLSWYPHHIAALVWRETQTALEGSSLVPPGVTFPASNTKQASARILREYPRARHFEDAHPLRRDKEGSWWSLAQASGLTGLPDIDFRATDRMLCSAFLERWYPETNSFHFPDFGEMTITLHDIVQIVGLSINGVTVRSLVSSMEAYETMQQILGLESVIIAQQITKGGSYNCTTTLYDRLMKLLEAPERNEAHVATLYLALLAADTLFGDKSGAGCKVELLSLFFDHNQTGNYAWGAAVLAHMYRQFGVASRGMTNGVGGPMMILRSWIWHYFPALRGRVSFEVEETSDTRAARRIGREPSQPLDTKRLISFRRVLDRLTFQDVHWMPWGPVDFSDPRFAPSRYRGVLTVDVGDLVQEMYMPDRVWRQFGRIQDKPRSPPVPAKCERKSSQKAKVVLVYKDTEDTWDADQRTLLKVPPLSDGSLLWDCTPEYRDWWQQVSHRYTDYYSARHGVTPLPPDWATISRAVAGQIRQFLLDPPVQLPPQVMAMMTDAAGQLLGERPLRDTPTVRRPIYEPSTYDAGSGSGRGAVKEEDDQPTT